jgi:hypothetical protein
MAKSGANRHIYQFGKRFIILPNAMYGNWESAIYGNDFKLIEAEKAAKRKSQESVCIRFRRAHGPNLLRYSGEVAKPMTIPRGSLVESSAAIQSR